MKGKLNFHWLILLCISTALLSNCAADDSDYFSDGEQTILYSALELENVVKYGTPVMIDMDRDGTTDFSFTVELRTSDEGVKQEFIVASIGANQVLMHEQNALPYEADYEINDTVDTDLFEWSNESGLIVSRLEATESGAISWSGPWREVSEGYLVVGIRITDYRYYGWIKIVPNLDDSSLTIPEYALQTIAEKPIDTGQKM